MADDTESAFLTLVEQLAIGWPVWIDHCGPTWSWQPPPMADYDLWFILEGEGEVMLEGKIYALTPGATFLFPPGCLPRARQNPLRRAVIFAAHFDVSPEQRITDMAQLPAPGFLMPNRALFTELARQAVRGRERGDALGRAQTRAAVQQLLLLYWEAARSPVTRDTTDVLIQTLAAAVQSDPGQAWTVDTMAARCCLSRSQFTRRFQAAMDQSPTRFVIETRLARAERMIQETDWPLVRIADTLGYRDLFFFSRQFKRFRGIPPSQLRGAVTRS